MNESRISNDETESSPTPAGGAASGGVYTHGHTDAVLRSHRWRTLANSAAYLAPHLAPGLSVLDVGCGPGTLTADLAAAVAPGRVVAIDPEPAVLDEVRTAAAARGVEVEARAVDVATLAAESPPAFDVLHAHQVLQHVADPVATVRAMCALARPGGIVAARDADYSAMTWWPAEPLLDRWLDVYRSVTRHNGAECDAGRRLLHWARAAGCADVTYSVSAWTFWRPADLDWWSGLWAERTTSSRFAEQAEAYGVATRTELDDIAEAWRDWATRSDAVFTVPNGEILVRLPG